MTASQLGTPLQAARKGLPGPNAEQSKSLARSVLQIGGGALAGWGISQGWITPAEIQACAQTSADNMVGCLAHLPENFAGFVSNEALAGYVAAGAAVIWGMFTHTKKNTIKTADRMPEVAGVLLDPDHPEAHRVIAEIMSPKVALSGSEVAKEIAGAYKVDIRPADPRRS